MPNQGDLERTQIGDHRPALLGIELVGVAAHQVLAVGDDAEQFAIRLLNDALFVQVGDDTHRADLGNAVAVADLGVAGGTVDVEGLVALGQKPR